MVGGSTERVTRSESSGGGCLLGRLGLFEPDDTVTVFPFAAFAQEFDALEAFENGAIGGTGAATGSKTAMLRHGGSGWNWEKRKRKQAEWCLASPFLVGLNNYRRLRGVRAFGCEGPAWVRGRGRR